MCRNGRYTERGIKQIDGYASEQWTVEADYAVKLDDRLEDVGVLMEPTTVVAKAWEQVERIGARAWFEPQYRAGHRRRPDRPARRPARHAARARRARPRPGRRRARSPSWCTGSDATYHHSAMDDVMARVRPDVVIEATGAPALVFGAMRGTAPYGITVLTGVSSRGRTIRVDAGELNRDIVLENDVVVGSVNANLRHYAQAAEALAAADLDWLGRLVSRRVPLADFADAFDPAARRREGRADASTDRR